MIRPGLVEIHDVPRPRAETGEVLLRIRKIGVCGSDVHVYHGLHPTTSYPVVQGHEVSGTVEALGPGVEGVRVGSLATFMPQITCGRCHPCRHGLVHICDSLRVMGFQAPGAAQEYFAVPERLLVPLPDGMSAEAGAMVEPLAVGVHALERGGGAHGKRVVVIGAGPIGNLVAQVARASGATQVLIADKSRFRLDLASRCGIDFAVDVAATGLKDAVQERFGADAADLILECVGVEPTMAMAIEAARKGTRIVVVGVFGKRPLVDVGTVQDRELSLVGTLMYQREDYLAAIDLACAGKVRLDELVTTRFPFRAYAEAYRHIERAGETAMKVMIDLDEG
jgi:L-iditol 2-dehydrogenase